MAATYSIVFSTRTYYIFEWLQHYTSYSLLFFFFLITSYSLLEKSWMHVWCDSARPSVSLLEDQMCTASDSLKKQISNNFASFIKATALATRYQVRNRYQISKRGGHYWEVAFELALAHLSIYNYWSRELTRSLNSLDVVSLIKKLHRENMKWMDSNPNDKSIYIAFRECLFPDIMH